MRWTALVFILVPVLLWLAAAVISNVASCQYDDLPNVWQCNKSWAVPYMYNFDIVIFLFAYPVFFIGILLALIIGLVALFKSLSKK